MDIAGLSLRAQEDWFRHLAASGFPHLEIAGSLVVATGLPSNTENGALLAADRPGVPGAVVGWLRDRCVPASIVLSSRADPQTTLCLIQSGAQPERAGTVMGRALVEGGFGKRVRPHDDAVEIREVTSPEDLRANLGVYGADGWWESGESDRRFEVAQRLGFGPDRPIRHWTAYVENDPAGAATTFVFDGCALLVHCCVLEPLRRKGIASVLTWHVLTAAAGDGARQAVLSPSPDGYHLYRSPGFDSAPLSPDRWFYLA